MKYTSRYYLDETFQRYAATYTRAFLMNTMVYLKADDYTISFMHNAYEYYI